MLGYFLQYFTVSIRFHVIGRHRPFGSANSNKNVPTYLEREWRVLVVRRWSGKPFHRASVVVCQFRCSRYLLHFSLKDWSCLGCGSADRMVAGRLFRKGIMQSG